MKVYIVEYHDLFGIYATDDWVIEDVYSDEKDAKKSVEEGNDYLKKAYPDANTYNCYRYDEYEVI